MALVKRPDAREFILWLQRVLGGLSIPELAERVGQPERYLYRWRAGEHAPSFARTMAMLKSSGIMAYDRADSDLVRRQVTDELTRMRYNLTRALKELKEAEETDDGAYHRELQNLREQLDALKAQQEPTPRRRRKAS